MFEKRYRTKMRNKGYSLNEIYEQRLEELAKILGISKSEVIRRAIDEYYIKIIPIFCGKFS